MIERFRIQNFKALRDIELHLTPIHVLIGPNDSGKTSILEALASISRSVDHELNNAFEGPWEGRELVFQGMDLPLKFELDFKSNVTYRLAVEFAREGRAVRTHEELVGGQPLHSRRGTSVTSVCGVTSRGDEVSDPLRDVARQVFGLLATVHVYRWIPRLLALPCAPEPTRKFRMITEGFGLALVLDEILGFDRAIFNRIENRFREIFPQVSSIKLLQAPAFKSQSDAKLDFPLLHHAAGKGIYFQMGDQLALIPASQASDGLLLVLAYLTILNLPEPPRLLLIEEPENGIHPQRLREILVILRSLVLTPGKTQIVLTTHSPYVIDLFKPEEVTLCQRKSDGSIRVMRLSDSAAVQKQKDIFTLGEIWTGEGDEALSKNTVGSN